MAQAAWAVAASKPEGMAYVNVMNNISVDCDCDSSPADPDMADIGVLASLDPVALDRACVDMVYAGPAGGRGGGGIESRNGMHTLEHAEAIGLGSMTYELVDLDEASASYLTFAYDGSDNPDAAGRFIHPHQGFFVRTGLNGSMAYFQPDMRNTTAQNSTFRSNDHIDYPLVNLFVSEANGNSDMVTVELGRPTQGGALLMQGLRAGNGKIWCHYNDVDYAVAYTQPGVTEAAIRFESVADTEYTMRWNTHNGEFSFLHLLDNVTGAAVDCLATDEYRFSASTSDYKSRFRLVFGYTGIEEDSEAETNENFAFMMNDALVVTGEGVLQVFDMTGRLVTSQELHGVQTTVSLPNAANGVYVLRLTEGKQSRIQKMVISK